jgi:hypothetical protein
VAGCATMQMTPAQQRTWDAFHKCSAHTPTVRLDYIRQDGTYRYFYHGGADQKAMQECMQKERIEASKARFSFEFNPGLGAFTRTEPKRLVRDAYFTTIQPVGTLTASNMPAATSTFKVNQQVIFFLGLHKSGRILQGQFRWFRPDGTLASQQDRTLRDDPDDTRTWTWHTQILPPARLQSPGTWTVAAYLDGQLVGRYEFSVVSQ